MRTRGRPVSAEGLPGNSDLSFWQAVSGPLEGPMSAINEAGERLEEQLAEVTVMVDALPPQSPEGSEALDAALATITTCLGMLRAHRALHQEVARNTKAMLAGGSQ